MHVLTNVHVDVSVGQVYAVDVIPNLRVRQLA